MCADQEGRVIVLPCKEGTTVYCISLPIARYEVDGGIVGEVYIYDTEEQAAEAWNRRVNDASGERGMEGE